MKAYTPVSCRLYDRLTDLATRRKPVEIVFQKSGSASRTRIRDVITDIEHVEKREFLVLKSGGERIRLDYLQEVDGQDFSGSDSCAL